MVETAPAAPFLVAQTQLLLEFLIVAFDDPAVLGNLHQRLERDLLRQTRQPVFGGFRCLLRPFDQKPFFRVRLRTLVIAMRRTHADCGEPGAQDFSTTLPPTDLLPRRRRQPEGQLLYRNRLMVRVAL